MLVIDISVPLNASMTRWPGSVGCTLTKTSDRASGDLVTNSTMAMDLHCGTHLDAPSHFIEGASSIADTELGACIGPAFVVDLRGVQQIEPEHLEARVPADVVRLLLKTDNSMRWASGAFFREFAALTADAARWIVERGIRLVANDYLSIQLYDGDPETHISLFEAGVVVVEGVNLSGVEPGHYDLICLPLLISGAEAAPARAVLLTPERADA